MKHGYLIDMDGVLYRGTEIIPGAEEFIRQLRHRNIPFRFLTNNSQRTRLDVVAKLARMGIDVEEEHVFTCAMATARFLAQQSQAAQHLSSVKVGCSLHFISMATQSSITILTMLSSEKAEPSTWNSSKRR